MGKKSFQMPIAILNQLNEFSSGGFALFNFDDLGNPCVHTKFDTNKDAMALQMFIGSWSEALSDLSTRSTMNSIQEPDSIDDEDILNPEDEEDGYDDGFLI
jgi:hypothetical protein